MKRPLYPYNKKNKERVQGCFNLFMWVSLLNAGITRGVLDIFALINFFLNQITNGTWCSNIGAWGASASYGRHVSCILMTKYVVPLRHRKHRLVLFLMVQCVVVLGGWFIIGGCFSLSLSPLVKVCIKPRFVLFLNFSPHIFYCLF